MVVETLLITSMAAFYFAVMSRRSGPDTLMVYAQFPAKDIQRMNSVRLGNMSKLCTVVCLQDLGLVTEITDGTAEKIYSREAGLFQIWIEKSLP